MVLEVLKDEAVTKPSSGSGCGSCGDEPGSRCGNGLEKIYPTIVVRYGYMKFLGEFAHAPDMKFGCGAKVVVQTHRGIEIGEEVSLSCTGCSKCVSREQIQAYIKNSGAEQYHFSGGRILREATQSDLLENGRMISEALSKLRFCKEAVRRHSLPMKLVECEHLFGGERVIFYFMSETRVDFRDLVKELGAEFRTRIEMRQVGARDEARLVADYETCGQECCCKKFLKTLKPVSMKMAKMQKATLDPSKVSGRCGRLKCCLRYEHTAYEELDRLLPKLGERIRTAHGDGVVVNRQILTQLVQIELEDEKLITVAIEDVLNDSRPAAPRTQPMGPTNKDDTLAEEPLSQDEPAARPDSTSTGRVPAEGEIDRTSRRGRRRGPRRPITSTGEGASENTRSSVSDSEDAKDGMTG